jgi:hypothetical protein
MVTTPGCVPVIPGFGVGIGVNETSGGIGFPSF